MNTEKPSTTVSLTPGRDRIYVIGYTCMRINWIEFEKEFDVCGIINNIYPNRDERNSRQGSRRR
jgi:hypothetical protein